MKNRVFILLLLLTSLNVFSQVPNTTTFSLQDVVDEVNPTTNDLGDCFNDYIPSYRNLTYWNSYYAAAGDLNNLLMFRDYGAHNVGVTYEGSGGIAHSTSTSLDVAYPSGVTVGDVLLLSIMVSSSDIGTGVYSAPSGWVSLGSAIDYGYDFYAVYYYRIADSNYSGTLELSTTHSVLTHDAIMYRYSGATSVNTTYANVGSYYFQSQFDVTPTPSLGEFSVLGVITRNISTVTISDDFSLDDQYTYSPFSRTHTISSAIGTGSQLTGTVTLGSSSINITLIGFNLIH